MNEKCTVLRQNEVLAGERVDCRAMVGRSRTGGSVWQWGPVKDGVCASCWEHYGPEPPVEEPKTAVFLGAEFDEQSPRQRQAALARAMQTGRVRGCFVCGHDRMERDAAARTYECTRCGSDVTDRGMEARAEAGFDGAVNACIQAQGKTITKLRLELEQSQARVAELEQKLLRSEEDAKWWREQVQYWEQRGEFGRPSATAAAPGVKPKLTLYCQGEED